MERKQSLDSLVCEIIQKGQRPGETIYVGPREIYTKLLAQGAVVHLDELADSLMRLEAEGWIERGMVFAIRSACKSEGEVS